MNTREPRRFCWPWLHAWGQWAPRGRESGRVDGAPPGRDYVLEQRCCSKCTRVQFRVVRVAG